MSEHTPGPWELTQEDEDSSIELCMSKAAANDSTYRTIHKIELYDSLYPEDTEDFCEGWANARLIAAAPDLLEACKQAKKYLEPDLVEPGRTIFWRLVSAIAKAEGTKV